MVCASEYFYHVPLYRIAICKTCSYAVWPNEAGSHLKGRSHRLPSPIAAASVQELYAWPNLYLSPAGFELPAVVERAISELPLYEDGYRCRLDPERCSIIRRSRKTLRVHWSEVHQWSVAGRRGAPSLAQRDEVERRRLHGAEPVCCQRFFDHGEHSSYVAVLQTPQKRREHGTPGPSIATAVFDELAALEEEQRVHGRLVQGQSSDKEVSPWLHLTR